MTNEELQLKKRLQELAARAADRSYYTYSEFLTLSEQSLLKMSLSGAEYRLFGGYPAAERQIVCFGSLQQFGYEPTPPIVCLMAAPIAPKFAEPLSHRDFLGSLIGLGIRREVSGDILVIQNTGYIFCLEPIAPYITQQLIQVRRTPVHVTQVDAPPAEAIQPPQVTQIVVASERLDAIVAAVYRLSRSDSQQLFHDQKIFADGRQINNTSFTPSSGHLISVRGYGRFLYEGIEQQTRKGRLRANVRIY